MIDPCTFSCFGGDETVSLVSPDGSPGVSDDVSLKASGLVNSVTDDNDSVVDSFPVLLNNS